MFGQLLPVDIDAVALALILNRIAGQTYDPLYVINLGVAGKLEHDDVAAPDPPVRKNRKLYTVFRPEEEFIDQQVIADEYSILHRSGRHLHRLDDKGHSEQRHYKCHNRRLEILAHDALLHLGFRLLTGDLASGRGYRRRLNSARDARGGTGAVSSI